MSETAQEVLYGIWITNVDGDGSGGRWMSDRDNGKDIWSTADQQCAEAFAQVRREFYHHLIYEVRPCPQP